MKGPSLLQVYLAAARLAQREAQYIGPKNDYYVTLAQLEDILQRERVMAGRDPEAPRSKRGTRRR